MGHVTNLKAKKKSVRKQVPFKWGPEQQRSFEAVIDKLTNPPVLAYADYSLPFKVHMDASLNCLGAVLYQTQEGVDRVIAYASRSLKPSEKNYPAHKLEFLALKWFVTEKFHNYLYGSLFEVITDNNPPTYILTTAKLDATGQRWVASLSDYIFTNKYRSGKKNADADGLSRHQEGNTGECTVFPDVIKAVSMSVTAMECPFIDSVYASEASDSTPPFTEDISEQLLQTHCLTAKDWRKAQLQDLSLSFVIKCLEACLPAPSRRSLDQVVDAKYINEWNKMILSYGVLHRKVTLNGQNFLQLVLPPAFREDVFKRYIMTLGIKAEVGPCHL